MLSTAVRCIPIPCARSGWRGRAVAIWRITPQSRASRICSSSTAVPWLGPLPSHAPCPPCCRGTSASTTGGSPPRRPDSLTTYTVACLGIHTSEPSTTTFTRVPCRGRGLLLTMTSCTCRRRARQQDRACRPPCSPRYWPRPPGGADVFQFCRQCF